MPSSLDYHWEIFYHLLREAILVRTGLGFVGIIYQLTVNLRYSYITYSPFFVSI